MQSPDGKWTNWSIARAMIYDNKHLVGESQSRDPGTTFSACTIADHDPCPGLVIEPQHIWQIHQLWKKEGRDAPWALCFGVRQSGSVQSHRNRSCTRRLDQATASATFANES